MKKKQPKELPGISLAIKEARKRRGFTQRHLASRAAVSLMTVSRLENGDDGISLNILRRICEQLGLKAGLIHTKRDQDIVFENESIIIYKK